ncbi:unnamed protein product, partial [Mesorhabditis belari]|uniref:CHK kinase-like domain-containing protein n=1 Tax=Mesorhabditis belari TaxID=2138241 RepID=A0AAF3JBZ6_9BILA
MATNDFLGLVSSIFVLNLDLASDIAQLVPHEVLLKLTSKQSMINVSKSLSGKCSKEDEELRKAARIVHNTEHHLYQRIDQLEMAEGCGIPKYFGGIDYSTVLDTGYFLIEVVKDVHPVRYYDNISMKAVSQVLESLARLNAKLISNRDLLSNFNDKICADFSANNSIRGGYGIERCAAGFLSIASRYPNLDREANLLASFAESDYPLLCHWDCHLGNVLWAKDEKSNKWEMLKIVDWQTVHLNNPIIDVCRITFSALSPDDFGQHLESLLHLYYKTLSENTTGQLPWKSFETMRKAYDLVFPLQVILVGYLLGNETFVERQVSRLTDSEKSKARCSIEAKLHSYVNYAARCVEKYYLLQKSTHARFRFVNECNEYIAGNSMLD